MARTAIAGTAADLRAARRDLRLSDIPAARARDRRRPADAGRAQAAARSPSACSPMPTSAGCRRCCGRAARRRPRFRPRWPSRCSARCTNCCAGFDAAEPKLIRELARTRPEHLYEGLLTVLMRLVFILYAEDRDLLPSRTDGRAREIYETSYSRARALRQAGRGCRAQSRHDGRAARRLGPAAGAVPADPQGPSKPFRPGARRQAVRSG